MILNGIGFKNGVITLDEPDAVYYPAQTVSGKIEFELQEPLSFSAINVIYRGEANVSWTEQQTEKYSGVKRYINVEYKANEEYFNFMQCVYGGNGPSFLNSGTHSIPFSYQIPYTAPSSFESTIGRVSYKITAYLECPPVMREELVKTFEIVAPLDLNKDTTGDIKRPINMEFEEVYSCCCSSEPITIGIKLPVSGYCPGQPIPITIDVKNDSSMEISKMRFQLVMKERYHSRNPVSENVPPEKVLATKKKGAVMGKTRRQYQCELKVPDMLAPNLDNCDIIDIGYFFKVTIKLPGCMDDFEDESEVYIGMIPLEITTGGSSYVHPLKHRLPRGLPPVGLPLPYGNNGVNTQSNLIMHIPLHSPQMIQNHTSPLISYPVNTSPYPGYPHSVQCQIVPSAPVDNTSPYPVNYPIQSPIIAPVNSSPQPVFPYTVQHQTLVTASIETTSPHHVNSYQVQNQSPVFDPRVTVSPHSVNSFPIQSQNPVIVVKSPNPYPVYTNQDQSPIPLTTSMGTISPHIIQNQSPQSTPIQATSPHTVNPYPIQIQSPSTAPIETSNFQSPLRPPPASPHPVQNQSPIISPKQTTSPHLVNSSIHTQSPLNAPTETAIPQSVNSYPVQNQSPGAAPIKTTSPHPIENQSPVTTPIETTSPHPISPVPIQSPQTVSIETTSPHQVSSVPTQSPQTAPIEITSPHTVNSNQVLNETNSPLKSSPNSQTEYPSSSIGPEENKPYEIGFKI